MKNLTIALILIYSLIFSFGCDVRQSDVDEAVKQVYFAKERTRLANNIVLDLYKARIITLEVKNGVADASLAVYTGIEFANDRIKDILADLKAGIVTEKAATDYIRQIVSDEIIIPLNRLLVQFNLISVNQSDALYKIVVAIRTAAESVVSILNLKNVKIVGVKNA